jgi:P4 family phage/plasmid primase-like protien
MFKIEKIDTVKHLYFKNNIYPNKHMDDNPSNMTMSIDTKFKYPSRKFTDYLNKHRTSSTKKEGVSRVATHLSMCQPFGKFAIPQNEIEEFMDMYEDEIKNQSSLGIVEKPLSHLETPMVSDIDFKYLLGKVEEKKLSDRSLELVDLRRHNYKIIKEILAAYKRVYDENFYFRNPEDKNHCYFFVTQRQEPYIAGDEKKYIKDGFHIVNPGYRAFPKIHLEMRKKILQDETLQKCIASLGTVNSAEYTLDEAVICKNGWLLYGSSKPNRNPYEIAYIFDSSLNEATLEELNISSVPKYLSYWRTSSKHAIPIKTVNDAFISKQLLHTTDDYTDDENNEDNDEQVEHKNVETSDLKDSKKEKKKIKKKKNVKPVEIVEAENPNNSDYSITEKVKHLVGLLSEKRGTNKSLWKEVGECLKYLSSKGESHFDIWVEFSEKYETFGEKDCEKEWDTFLAEGPLSMATLKFWASKDSPKEYTSFKRNEIRKFLMKCINTTHVDVAQTLYLMYESQYVCSSLKQNTWYEFRRHRWYEIESGVSLRKKISKELALEYTRFRRFCIQMAESSPDGELPEDCEYDVAGDAQLAEYEISAEEWLSMASICDEVVIKLKTKGYKDSLLGEAKEFFYEEKFEEKLDERHELLGFDNGVVDLDKRIFREGRPDDYITLSTKTKYNSNYKDTKEYDEIMVFMKQLYLTDEMAHYGIKERAHMLHGDNFEERIFTHIGAGGNGKSKLRELCNNALSDYCFGFPVSLFTGKISSSSSASPEVARSKGKRMGFVDEPEHKSNFNIGLAKKFSGGDPIETRKLFGDMFEFIPQFAITLLCNNIPGFPAHDEGAQRRLTITEFCARFVDNPVNKNEFKRDRTLSTKLKAWKHVFASLLVDYFYIYQEEGLNPPEEVTKFTMQFIKECDSYNEFISDVLIEDSAESYVSIKELYDSFRSWGDDNGVSGRKPMSLRDFKKYISQKVNKPGSVRDGRIYGYRERTEELSY